MTTEAIKHKLNVYTIMKKFLTSPISSIIIGGGVAAAAALFGGNDVPEINLIGFGALVGTIVNGFKDLVGNQAYDVDFKTSIANAGIGAVSAIAGSLTCLI